jgi:hypothetical protein
MASQVPPKKNTAFTLYFSLFKNDGTVIANSGTYTKKISKDGGAVADITASVTEINTTYGTLSLVLSATEMNADAIWIKVLDDTTGCVPFVCTLYTAANLQDEIGTDVAALVDTGTTLDAKLDTIAGYVDTEVAAIKAKTDLIPTSPAAVGSAMTLSAGTILSIGQAVWDTLTTALTTVGSIGLRIMDWLGFIPAGATVYGATDLVLCNNALVLVGHDTLADMTGTDRATLLLAQFYQQTVDEVLRAYTWNCATVRSAALTAGTTPTFGYDYKYILPTGCLRVLKMSEEDYTFKVEGADVSSPAGYLVTDEGTAQITYINRISPAYMDPLLKAAISARLAAQIAFPLTNSTTIAEGMWKLYQAKIDEAQSIDAFEGTPENVSADELADVRR